MMQAALDAKGYDQRFAEATEMKAEGVALFKDGHYDLAQQKFAFAMLSTKAMLPKDAGGAGGGAGAMGGLGAMMGGMDTPEVPDYLLEQVIDLHCGLLNNMASILMNQGKLERAVDRLSETLAIRPHDTTALARRAKAHWKLNKLSPCEQDIAALISVDPTHKEGLKLKRQVDALNAEYAAKERNMFKGMFANS